MCTHISNMCLCVDMCVHSSGTCHVLVTCAAHVWLFTEVPSKQLHILDHHSIGLEIYRRKHAAKNVWMCVCVYMCTHVCVCVFVWVYTYTFTLQGTPPSTWIPVVMSVPRVRSWRLKNSLRRQWNLQRRLQDNKKDGKSISSGGKSNSQSNRNKLDPSKWETSVWLR